MERRDGSHRQALGEARARGAEDGASRGAGEHVQAAQLSHAPDVEAEDEALPAAERLDAGRRWWTLLSHPLLLLLLGAAFTAGVTNYLIPRVTHEWQKRDKELEIQNALRQEELEIKAALARNIGESIASILAAVHSTELTTHGQPGPAYDRAYEDWIVRSNGIASQIRVYFRQDGINDEWADYVDNVRVIYYVLKYERRVNEQRRLSLLREINLYLRNSGLGGEELKEIARFDAPSGRINILLDFYLRRLLDAFRERADQLIKTILDTQSVLREGSPARLSPTLGREATTRGVGGPGA